MLKLVAALQTESAFLARLQEHFNDRLFLALGILNWYLIDREWHGFGGFWLFWGNAMGLPWLAGRRAEPIDGGGGGRGCCICCHPSARNRKPALVRDKSVIYFVI